MLYHCRMWCYAIGVEAVVLRSWYVVWCTVCQLVSNFILPSLFSSYFPQYWQFLFFPLHLLFLSLHSSSPLSRFFVARYFGSLSPSISVTFLSPTLTLNLFIA